MFGLLALSCFDLEIGVVRKYDWTDFFVSNKKMNSPSGPPNCHWNSLIAVVTPYTSHLTSHTSHITHHTSHLTPHTTHHTWHVARHTSHVTRHTSHLTPHTTPLLTRHKVLTSSLNTCFALYSAGCSTYRSESPVSQFHISWCHVGGGPSISAKWRHPRI